jgi:hypothetical protein
MGRNLSINCEAHGKPTPNLSWIKKIDGMELNTSSSFSKILIFD